MGDVTWCDEGEVGEEEAERHGDHRVRPTMEVCEAGESSGYYFWGQAGETMTGWLSIASERTGERLIVNARR